MVIVTCLPKNKLVDVQFKHPNQFKFIKCQASDIRVTVTRKEGRKHIRKEGVSMVEDTDEDEDEDVYKLQ